MKRICHMTSAHPEKDVRIFHKECISLAEEGYEVYLVQRGESYEKNGVHVVGAGVLPKSRVKRVLLGARKTYKIAASLNCDLYQIHDPELLPYAVKLHKAGKIVVFDSHELYREQLKRKTRFGPLLAKVYQLYEKKALRKIDAVVFPCSINGKNPFEGQYLDFAYVNNVPRLSELYDRYDETALKEENSICYIGTISQSRGITNLIEASDIAGTKLYLAGNCHYQAYLNMIREMEEHKRITYLGVLDRNAIGKLLSSVKIGIATLLNVGQYSIADNLPTKVYEYMAMGVPSIISDTPFNRMINDKYNFGIVVDPSNPKEISNAIIFLLSNQEEYQKLSTNGRNAVKELFNWEKEVKHLTSLYERLFSKKACF